MLASQKNLEFQPSESIVSDVDTFKAECIHRLSEHYFRERLLNCLSLLDANSPEFHSAKNITALRVNMIISDISNCDSDLDTLRENLKDNFKTLQNYIKALKSSSMTTKANECIVNSFRIILEEMHSLGDLLKEFSQFAD